LQKAKKVASKLRNGTLNNFVAASPEMTAAKFGTFKLVNQTMNEAFLFTKTHPESLYYPGQTPDDRLAKELAWELVNVDNLPFSTRQPTKADYDKNIVYLSEQIQVVKNLQVQLTNKRNN
jgi:hypothetical protein